MYSAAYRSEELLLRGSATCRSPCFRRLPTSPSRRWGQQSTGGSAGQQAHSGLAYGTHAPLLQHCMRSPNDGHPPAAAGLWCSCQPHAGQWGHSHSGHRIDQTPSMSSLQVHMHGQRLVRRTTEWPAWSPMYYAGPTGTKARVERDGYRCLRKGIATVSTGCSSNNRNAHSTWSEAP